MRIHHPAVVAAAIGHWIAGALWYASFTGPFTTYMGSERLAQLASRNEELAFALAFVSSLTISYVLAWQLQTRPSENGSVMKTVILVWIGFVVAAQAPTVLFEGRHPGLFILGVGYQLVALALMSAILTRRMPKRAAVALS